MPSWPPLGQTKRRRVQPKLPIQTLIQPPIRNLLRTQAVKDLLLRVQANLVAAEKKKKDKSKSHPPNVTIQESSTISPES
jgi:hypothetical protein